MDVSRETTEYLEAFEQLVLKWNRKINLISRNTVADIRLRHIEDSVQLANLLCDPAGTWVDLGSGGGFPAIPLAIFFRNEPNFKIVLVESDQRKCAFLRTVSRELGIDFEVISSRIEDLQPNSADYVSARALAPLDQLLMYSLRLKCSAETTCYFLKGQSWITEVKKAQEQFTFSLDVFDSVTQEGAAILKIKDLRRA